MYLLLIILLCGVVYGGDATFYIHNASDLIKFSGNVNSGTNYTGTTVYLENDIDFTGRTMEPIGNLSNRYFMGTFDGQGHTISNLKMNVTTSEFTGLFGYSSGSIIKDVVMDGSCSVVNSHMNSDCAYMGGIIGQHNSNRRPCTIENIVNMARVSFSGNILYDLHLGGIIGVEWVSVNYNAAVINCINYGDVVHEGTVGRYCDIGGIVGHFKDGLKYIQNCINYGTIYHNGVTAGEKLLGGIAGFMPLSGTANERSFVENCLSAGEIMSNNETFCSKGSVVGSVNSITNITHCFWTNNTGCDTACGTNDTNVAITNSSRAELNADLLKDMIEYAKQNTNTGNNSSFSLGEYHVLHLNGGRINSIAQETLLVTQRRFPAPLKDGTAFLFWCGDISCNATYNASDSSASSMVDVYAIWNTSTVTFNFMNGSDSSVKSIFQFNTSITYPENVVREGYTHTGWEPAYSLMPGTDVTLYAQWEEISTNYVEIIFGTKDLTEEEIKSIIKRYTNEVFTIIEFDTSGSDSIRVIIEFVDTEEAIHFIENIRSSSDSALSMIEDIEFAHRYRTSFYSLIQPLLLLNIGL